MSQALNQNFSNHHYNSIINKLLFKKGRKILLVRIFNDIGKSPEYITEGHKAGYKNRGIYTIILKAIIGCF